MPKILQVEFLSFASFLSYSSQKKLQATEILSHVIVVTAFS